MSENIVQNKVAGGDLVLGFCYIGFYNVRFCDIVFCDTGFYDSLVKMPCLESRGFLAYFIGLFAGESCLTCSLENLKYF